MARQQRQENGTGLFPPFAFASTSSGAGAGGNGGGKLSGKEEMKNCPSCGVCIVLIKHIIITEKFDALQSTQTKNCLSLQQQQTALCIRYLRCYG